MQLRFGYLIAAGAIAAILSAPTAVAAPGSPGCTDTGAGTECSSPGNVQINDAPPAVDPALSGVYPGPYPVPWDEGSR